jgi:hypothetical protein
VRAIRFQQYVFLGHGKLYEQEQSAP